MFQNNNIQKATKLADNARSIFVKAVGDLRTANELIYDQIAVDQTVVNELSNRIKTAWDTMDDNSKFVAKLESLIG